VKLSLKNHAYGRKIIDQTKIRWDPNIHMASIHEERKLIQCPNIKLVCHKYFQQEVPIRNKSQISVIFVRNVLKRGVKIPFKYTFFKSIFFQKLHFRGHVEKVHEGKHPFYVLFVEKNTQKSDLTD
jgi:hypothetical protein